MARRRNDLVFGTIGVCAFGVVVASPVVLGSYNKPDRLRGISIEDTSVASFNFDPSTQNMRRYPYPPYRDRLPAVNPPIQIDRLDSDTAPFWASSSTNSAAALAQQDHPIHNDRPYPVSCHRNPTVNPPMQMQTPNSAHSHNDNDCDSNKVGCAADSGPGPRNVHLSLVEKYTNIRALEIDISYGACINKSTGSTAGRIFVAKLIRGEPHCERRHVLGRLEGDVACFTCASYGRIPSRGPESADVEGTLALSGFEKIAVYTPRLELLVTPGAFDSSLSRTLKLGWFDRLPDDQACNFLKQDGRQAKELHLLGVPCPDPDSERVSAVATLPQELLALIMQQLRSLPATLKACSLVCRDWRSPAQRYLFASVTLRNHVSCNNMNRLFKGSSHLIPYVNRITIKGQRIDYLHLRGATGFIEHCLNIRTLEVDGGWVGWSAISQDFVISNLKRVERLIVKGKFPMETLKELLQGLPVLCCVELHPWYDGNNRHRSTPALSNTTPAALTLRLRELALSSIESNDALLTFLISAVDSSHLTTLKLAWLIDAPLESSTVQVLKKFSDMHGNHVKCLSLFGVFSSWPKSADVSQYAEALTFLGNVQELAISMSLSKRMYYMIIPNNTNFPVPIEPVAVLLSNMALTSSLRNVVIKLVLRVDQMGSKEHWEAINSVLCADQRFPNLLSVTLEVMLVYYTREYLFRSEGYEPPNFYVSQMTSLIHSCMPILLSSGKLNAYVTISTGWEDRMITNVNLAGKEGCWQLGM
ncbi:hypothetical protein D9758_009448 [Tetrapyrgos nigripes]|uniref:F-box domain-containing protein n=1 Tax=Tetrapyrgos nigripes TaxID=182062 RepID=A0A8H5FX73_9AGAR|nr:hypothetical protein D9758_009448 [Tetrapyrgos nigripes]